MHKNYKKIGGLGTLGPVHKSFIICCFCAFLWRFLAFVSGDAFGERVAVDAEDGRGFREVLVVPGQGFLNIELLKLAHRLIQQDVAFEHFVDEAFKSGVNQSSFPVNNRYASK